MLIGQFNAIQVELPNVLLERFVGNIVYLSYYLIDTLSRIAGTYQLIN